MKNKKAQAFSMIWWIPRIIFLVIVISSVVFLTTMYLNTEKETWKTESELFIHRLIHSPNGISYYDPLTNRVYPGIIDLNNIRDLNTINRSIFYGENNKHIGANISIYNQNNILLAQGIYNNQVYRRIQEKGILGIGGIDSKQKKLYILIKDHKNYIPAFMEITIAVPRS
ncbi:hypothetical protein GF361_03875 [Candidatus Woesearchaeota archaeon]|nr:hypothetical protein [Candidatus Woesearchaeota archaeon]